MNMFFLLNAKMNQSSLKDVLKKCGENNIGVEVIFTFARHGLDIKNIVVIKDLSFKSCWISSATITPENLCRLISKDNFTAQTVDVVFDEAAVNAFIDEVLN